MYMNKSNNIENPLPSSMSINTNELYKRDKMHEDSFNLFDSLILDEITQEYLKVHSHHHICRLVHKASAFRSHHRQG